MKIYKVVDGIEIPIFEYHGELDSVQATLWNGIVHGIDFNHSILCKNKFNDVSFGSANLSWSNFSGCDFENVSFSNCNLSSVNFKDCNFRNVTFNDVSFGAYSNFNGSELNNVKFLNCSGQHSKLCNCKLKNIKILNSNLCAIDFYGSTLALCNFSNSMLQRMLLYKVNIDNFATEDKFTIDSCDLTGAHFKYKEGILYLKDCNLTRATFRIFECAIASPRLELQGDCNLSYCDGNGGTIANIRVPGIHATMCRSYIYINKHKILKSDLQNFNIPLDRLLDGDGNEAEFEFILRWRCMIVTMLNVQYKRNNYHG